MRNFISGFRGASRIGALASVAAMAAFGIADAHTLAFQPVRDNTLYENATGAVSNGHGDHCFAGNTGTASKRRALLVFDLSLIPPGATVTGVTLQLTLDRAAGASGVRAMSLHRVTASWGEGTSEATDPFHGGGQGGPAATGDATWLHRFFSTTQWTSAGGDFALAASATKNVSETLGDYIWTSTPALVADVQQWLATPAQNFGWALRGDESVAATARRFYTREATTPALRPKLTVTFTSVTDVPVPGPGELVFAPAWPNPFNPTTRLRWELPVAGLVHATVHDVRGILVATLVDGTQSAGPHTSNWDARDARGNVLPSGVYVVRVEQGAAVRTQRVTLVR